MARAPFLVGTAAWLLLGVAGIVVAMVGRDALTRVLPDLAIDADALGGAIAGIAAGAVAIGLAHLAVAVGFRAGRRFAVGVGILLASLLAAGFAALAAAALASAQREAALAPALIAGALAAAVIGLAYGWVAWQLVGERRAGSAV